MLCISVVTVPEFHSEAGEFQFNAFLHPDEHPERICLYLERQFEAELTKIGQIFTKKVLKEWLKK